MFILFIYKTFLNLSKIKSIFGIFYNSFKILYFLLDQGIAPDFKSNKHMS